MKNIHKILFALLILVSAGCEKDKFAELNTDPSVVQTGDLRYQVTKAIEQMYSDDYTNWFYNNFQYIYPWTQVTTKQGGNNSDFVDMGPSSSFNIYSSLLPQTIDVRNTIDKKPDAEKASYQAIKAMTYPIQILPAIYNTDNFGSLVYTEAGLGSYTNPPLLTPVLDNQSTLFTTWLKELDDAIEVLSKADGQIDIGDQDIIYKGDYAKWAKFCNLLKLKIAARLINQDRAKALQIASEVVNSPAGYMNDLGDDFVYQRGIKYYGTGNEMWIGYASKNLVDFMVANKDPRVRFIFEKNDFNAEVVQAFLDAGKDLPPYVAQYVNVDANKKFTGWKAPGEPWVRYQGAPVSPDAKQNPVNNIYFNQSVLNRIKVGDVEKIYASTSLYSEKMVRTSYDFTYPTKPGGRVIELKKNDPGLNVILGSSAETNLLLAEFKLLGANLPGSAQEYFNKGVEFSALRMDAVAKNNQMPYYNSDPVYTNNDEAEAAATKLRSNEIADLLAKPAYDLTTDGLEKVYIQEYINYATTPGDVWATVRRSGVPKKGSAYLPWENFTAGGTEMVIPRRFEIVMPGKDDVNYKNKMDAITEQGITPGVHDAITLNTQRLWFDLQNPQYGNGPK
ncbi:MAG TPA: SusD/RagB family nutrient-binding outer membrane lipoprotein [Prolixibacteraceae bacterium]|nr:SusD/RagB family nutrient-binding outer membrane lipoprotein [Prolixibacteraceae bacterium]